MVGFAICMSNTEVKNGLFKGELEFPVISVHNHGQKQDQFML